MCHPKIYELGLGLQYGNSKALGLLEASLLEQMNGVLVGLQLIPTGTIVIKCGKLDSLSISFLSYSVTTSTHTFALLMPSATRSS